MAIGTNTIEQLLHLLRPLMQSESERKGYLMRSLGISTPVLNRLVFNQPVDRFITDMLRELVAFSETTPGQPALCALLEVIREDVGEDVKLHIDELVQQVREELIQQKTQSSVPGNSCYTPSPKRTLIFISSEFHEFQEEKQVLEETLNRLQELYNGIEYFSSDSNSSLEECIYKIQESALYIGLFSDNSGSINRESHKSRIELEYDAAKSKNIPCLIYFKKAHLSEQQYWQDKTSLNHEAFKANLLKNDIVNFYENINQLQQIFLVDFVKILRHKTFNDVEINQQNPFSLDALHLLSKATINEQIKLVARDKYIPDIYIERALEKDIEDFVDFDKYFSQQTDQIINDLTLIYQRYHLRKQFYDDLLNAQTRLRLFHSLDQYAQFINQIKKIFYFHKIERLTNLMRSSIRLSKEKNIEFNFQLIKIDSLLKELPFIDEQNNLDIIAKIDNIRYFLLSQDMVNISNIYRSLEKALVQIFPSKIYGYQNNVPIKWKFANDLIKELDNIVQLQFQRCITLVSSAGYGKTNLICRTANILSENYPVVLLSGQMEVTSQHNIEYHLQRQLESFLPGSFANWINRFKISSNDSDRKYLFILIDGINENSNLPLFVRLLRDFIAKIEIKRIKVILTCRNIFWDLFSASLKPSIFKNKILELNEFTEQEIRQALQLYFTKFNIQSSCDANTISSLRNPLLLRFLCEAYRNRQIDKVTNIELLSVFNLYLERVEAKINEQLDSLRTNQGLCFLTKLGNQMWKERKLSIKLSELEISHEQANKSTSLYNLIRSENIIFEESLQLYATHRSVSFLYDEFMEYIIARSWVENLCTSQELEQAIEILLQEAVSALSSFSPAFGAIIFLDKMLNRNGELLNRTISLLATSEDEFFASRQIVMLSAFENIAVNNVSHELIVALDTFERIARDEIKEQLAPIILKILRHHPNHPVTKEMISRMLEVNKSKAIVLKDETNESESKSEPSKKSNTEQLRLPPGRYHYKEETKLNAISILVSSKNTKDFEIVEESIKNMGKMDLHSALTALTSLDLADDELLYKIISKYYKASLAEYRIYCAWLLRNRYGQQPAEHLTGLLMDIETRVHRYTYSIFQERRIEKELVDSLVLVIYNIDTIKHWHLIKIIKILGKRNQFYPQYLIESYGKLIVSALSTLCNHSQASVRLEAYKSLTQYDEFIERQYIIDAMKKDNDIYIRKLAESIKLDN